MWNGWETQASPQSKTTYAVAHERVPVVQVVVLQGVRDAVTRQLPAQPVQLGEASRPKLRHLGVRQRVLRCGAEHLVVRRQHPGLTDQRAKPQVREDRGQARLHTAVPGGLEP